jgi:hypothetical protein
MLDDRDVRRLLLSTASRDATGFEKLYRKAEHPVASMVAIIRNRAIGPQRSIHQIGKPAEAPGAAAAGAKAG